MSEWARAYNSAEIRSWAQANGVTVHAEQDGTLSLDMEIPFDVCPICGGLLSEWKSIDSGDTHLEYGVSCDSCNIQWMQGKTRLD